MKNRFTDLDLRFIRHPIKKDISILVDESAIAKSIHNLIMTSYYEIPFEKGGSNLRKMLFELISPITSRNIKNEIESVLKNYEPRITIYDVSVDIYNENSYIVTIIFYIENKSEPLNLNFILQTIR